MPNDEVTQKDIENVLSGFLKRADDELFALSEEQIKDAHWYFSWDESKSMEWNIYQFNKALDMYKHQVRRWEEFHNGSCCVVERVRDKYLMPKIREFKNLFMAATIDWIKTQES